MALFYSNQSQIEALSRKTAVATYRLSEQRQILFGGRGSKYDELVYLRGQNASAQTVSTKDSDAWSTFAGAQGITGTTRADQKKRDFWQTSDYP